MVWHYDKHGKFTVKSVYLLARTLASAVGPSCTPRSWDFIWKSSLLPKVKLFVWPACLNSLPTSSTIRKRGVPLGGGYKLCGAEDIVAPATADVESWFRGIRSRGTWHDFIWTAMTSWALWCNRNKKVFEGAGMMAHEVVELGRHQADLGGGRVMYDPG
ncbi:hypothetical protein Salat_1688200 [Sesamum alatum]|uniref:Reverse transcriptase zinc-binding domain-containing protein n=1 Tax=Sesamum alatum TaxID=300844 RepID=A0AAE1Y758_9LAMI|nr:hypothetical protein Salat_1688200 [Sesamum alatum]